jgi:hypothetical protein
MAFKFENLRVWQMAVEYANDVHLLTRKFPKEKCSVLLLRLKEQQILYH